MLARVECSSPILWSLDSAIIPNKSEPDAGLDAVLRRKIETGSLDVFLKSEPDPLKQLIWGITGKLALAHATQPNPSIQC